MLRPGLVNMRRKNCVVLSAAGRRAQFFSPQVHQTWQKPFSGALCKAGSSFNEIYSSLTWVHDKTTRIGKDFGALIHSYSQYSNSGSRLVLHQPGSLLRGAVSPVQHPLHGMHRPHPAHRRRPPHHRRGGRAGHRARPGTEVTQFTTVTVTQCRGLIKGGSVLLISTQAKTGRN